MLETPPGDPDAPITPKVKRSLFKNRPDWAAKESSFTSHSNDDNFFSRSTETLSTLGYDSGGKRKEAKAPEHVKTASKPIARDDGRGQHASKRRRLSERSGGDDEESDYAECCAPAREDHGSDPAQHNASPSRLKRPKQAPKTVDTKSDGDVVVIDLSEDEDGNEDCTNGHDNDYDDDDGGVPNPAPHKPVSSSNSLMPSVETEPSPALITLENDISNSEQPDNPQTLSTPIEIHDKDPNPQPQEPPAQPQPPPHDPVLLILIHSRIPDTTPLIAQRKFSQRLQEVRAAWCAKQGLTPEAAAQVYLTWRGKRVFDFTTFKSLGIRVNDMGEVYIKGQCQPPGEEGAQIEMEAVNPAVVEEMRLEKERAAREPGSDEDFGLAGQGDAAASEAKENTKKSDQTNIILRAQGLEEYKLRVHATTTFGKIANAFRRARHIPADKQVVLTFDGDTLEPADEMKSSDVGQLDTIDVYIK